MKVAIALLIVVVDEVMCLEESTNSGSYKGVKFAVLNGTEHHGSI
jgi:hypothetical protein